MANLRCSWRGSTYSKKQFLQLICVKKYLFQHIQVLEMKFLQFWFISQRSNFFFEFSNKMWHVFVWTTFQHQLGSARWHKNLVFTASMDKKILFLACRSVRNSFLKFLVNVLGTQIWPPCEKSPQFFATWLPDLDFFQGLEIERRPPQQFSTIFWDVLDPPSHSEYQKKNW